MEKQGFAIGFSQPRDGHTLPRGLITKRFTRLTGDLRVIYLMKLEHTIPLLNIDTTEEAIGFIVGNVPPGISVGFSGGKDSIVTAKLMELSGIPHTLEYSFTGMDPPEIVRFIRKYYPNCKNRRNKRNFWKDLAVSAPPSDRLRWCCTLLKKTNSDQVHGIRAEESSRRSSRKRINHYKGRITYYPIFHWKEWQIWQFIEEHALAYPVLYDWGFDRIGCVVCPYHSERTGNLHAKYRKHWPKFFERFEKGITELYYKRVSQGKRMAHKTPKDFLDAWYLDDSARWYAKDTDNQSLNLTIAS